MSRESKRLKNQAGTAVEFWQCTNTASENAIFAFPVLLGSAEAQVI